MTSYDDLPDAEQVRVLNRVAVSAAPRFGLDSSSVELVAHAWNTTFSAGGAHGRVALRVHTNSLSTPAHVRAQHAWVRHLAEHWVAVPTPVRTLEASDLAEVEGGGRRWTVTAATWLEGPDLDTIDEASAHVLGQLIAQMHDLADGFVVPEGGVLPSYDEPLFGDPHLLETWPGWTPAEAAVVAEAFARTCATHSRLAAAGPAIPCHADLYAANLKRTADGLAVFDFDDMGLTAPAVDLGTTLFHLRGQPGAESRVRVEAALLEGYAERRPLPVGADGPDLEALVASRQLLLSNALLLSTTSSWQDRATDDLRAAAGRLRAWLDTGCFEVHPAG